MHTVWSILFWASLVTLAYAYGLYPLAIALLARWRPHPALHGDDLPTVTVLIAAYDEETCIAAKLQNTLDLDYPPERLDILVVTDGSRDRTPVIVAAWPDVRVRLLHQPQRQGKSAAIARAWPHVRSEVALFTDADALLPAACLRQMVRWFADPAVGAVSGAKRFRQGEGGAAGQGEGLYWRYESFLKRCDSAVGSVMGAPGEVWAARRVAYRPSEADILLDDFVASMRLVAAGWRVLYEPAALSMEAPSPSLGAEWERRARNAAGSWQAIARLREMGRAQPLVVWQYLSHRVLRWTAAPLALPLLFVSSLALASATPYAFIAGLQMLGYICAAWGGWLAARGKGHRLLAPLWYICLLHAVALAGGWRYLTGRQSPLWRKVR